jgi:PAS domain-containing protein
LEYRILRPDGEIRTVFTLGALLIKDQKGKPLKLIGVTQDITAQKQLDRELKQALDKVQSLRSYPDKPVGKKKKTKRKK